MKRSYIRPVMRVMHDQLRSGRITVSHIMDGQGTSNLVCTYVGQTQKICDRPLKVYLRHDLGEKRHGRMEAPIPRCQVEDQTANLQASSV